MNAVSAVITGVIFHFSTMRKEFSTTFFVKLIDVGRSTTFGG